MAEQGCSIILVNPPVSAQPGPSYLQLLTRGLSPEQYFSWPIEHLGLMSITAYARSKGLIVDVVDGIVDEHCGELETFSAVKAIAERRGPPKLVGFSSLIAFTQNIRIAELCKLHWPDVINVFGNDFASLNWKRLLSEYPMIDVVGIGEGEENFAQLALACLRGGSFEGIPGLAWRTADGRHVIETPSPLNLDTLPWPARDSLARLRPRGFAPAVFTSRGCPYRCSFCSTGAFSGVLGGNGYRSKSVEGVVDEIAYLQRDFGCEFVTIVDDLFVTSQPASQDRAARFARELLRRNLHVQFMFDARIDSIDKSLFSLLFEAGLRRVVIGIETGDTGQLFELYAKQYALHDHASVESQLRILTDLGIQVIPGILPFHPTVSPNELRKTIALLDLINYRNFGLLATKVLAIPGTPLHERYRSRGYLLEEWPLGVWQFQDPGAETLYDQVIQDLLSSDGPADFEGLRHRLLGRLDAWEYGGVATASD